MAGATRDERPVVIAAREKNAMRLVAVDRKAHGLGLQPGLALADARARIPAICVRQHAPEVDRAFLEQIAQWCERYTPIVAEEHPDGLVLEISGSAHLFGGEARLRDDLDARFARAGITVRTALASTVDCARALARFRPGGIVAPGAEAEAVRPLPVAALEAGAEKTTALVRAGLMTIGHLASQPRKPLAARFGTAFVTRLEGLLGRTDRPLSPRRPVPDFASETRFADPIGLGEDVELALDILAHDLCRQLAKAGRGGRVFEAVFFRADGTQRRLRALSGRPLRKPQPLKKLFLTRLDALADPLDPGFGFDMIRLCALIREEAGAEQTSFEGEAADAQAVADLVDRLTARFGSGAVERFVAQESHLPERAVKRLAAVSAKSASAAWETPSPAEPPLRPLMLFTPPQPVETVAEVPDGPPRRFRWRRVQHDIVHAEGPERIAPEWWRDEAALTRDYYRVEDREGRRFWLFREGIYGRETQHAGWFIHGVFA